ncbi:hypothetical protein A3F36_03515 [Candidatus Peribacteria bacterium RIFCSPHIGHO2_12_FULL_55_11]|nr:MAG: hypothetical protein A3F36_03515 [Candidatus Peribacteria bacterium RIFCSPHIGHO2_12_FULL_55_11]
MLARILTIVGLQGFAVLTAMLHQHLGVHTDEAKYLLNIPYPHPPLMRWIMGLTDGWQHQELFWRIFFASCLIQCVWLVADMARNRTREERLTLCGLWLFTGALLLQAGTLMMATITAVEALFLCWMLARPELLRKWSILIAALWLEMLFVAYQGTLFAPLVWLALQKSNLSFSKRLTVFVVPIILLALYTLTNPLAVASLGLVGGMGRGADVSEILLHTFKLWLIGGSGVLSILGLLGMIRHRHWALFGTFLLVTIYCGVSYREYYAILFAPLFIAGAALPSQKIASPAFHLALQMVIGVLLFLYIPFAPLSTARAVRAALDDAGIAGPVLINGSFGHEWQYLMPGPVRKYNREEVDSAVAVICSPPGVCVEADHRLMDESGFRMYPGYGDEVWIRNQIP